MKRLLRGLCALLLMTLLLPTALAAKATPTPPPVAISTEAPVQPPEQIQQVLDIAYNEWAELDGKTLKNVNKYTEWRGKGIGFGWCGGYITWCMMQANVEMEELEAVKKAAKESEDGVFVQVEGVHHVKEASVGKLLRGYQLMNRTTNVPQPLSVPAGGICASWNIWKRKEKIPCRAGIACGWYSGGWCGFFL